MRRCIGNSVIPTIKWTRMILKLSHKSQPNSNWLFPGFREPYALCVYDSKSVSLNLLSIVITLSSISWLNNFFSLNILYFACSLFVQRRMSLQNSWLYILNSYGWSLSDIILGIYCLDRNIWMRIRKIDYSINGKIIPCAVKRRNASAKITTAVTQVRNLSFGSIDIFLMDFDKGNESILSKWFP